MTDLFLSILNMSITASWLIFAVILLRLLLKKTPKSITWLFWILVGIRMTIPFSFKSMYSLLPTQQSIPQGIVESNRPMIESGIEIIDNTINPIISHNSIVIANQHVNFVDFIVKTACIVWVIGVISMFVYCIVSYLKLKRQTEASILYKDNAYFCDEIYTPFILGVIHPKIYIPSHIEDHYMESVLMHEKSHLRRKDHIWKIIGYLILSIHWFNPLAWVAYILFGRDIELACDELVIMKMEDEGKKEYCNALVSLSDQNRLLLVCPLAFGEIGVKERIKTIANYKRPTFWIIMLSCMLCLCACVGFMSDPAENKFSILKINDGAHFEKALDNISFMEIGSGSESYTALYDEDIKTYVESLSSLRLVKEAVSEERSKDRFKDCYIYMYQESGSSTKIYFDMTLDEIWIDAGVNVSLTYKIENKEVLQPLFGMFDGTVSQNFENNPTTLKVSVLEVLDDDSLLVLEYGDSNKNGREIELITKTKEQGKNKFMVGETLTLVLNEGYQIYEFNGRYRINKLANIFYKNGVTTLMKDYGTSTLYTENVIDIMMDQVIDSSQGYFNHYCSVVELYYDEAKMLDLFENKYADEYTSKDAIIIFARVVPSRTFEAYDVYPKDIEGYVEDGHHLKTLPSYLR